MATLYTTESKCKAIATEVAREEIKKGGGSGGAVRYAHHITLKMKQGSQHLSDYPTFVCFSMINNRADAYTDSDIDAIASDLYDILTLNDPELGNVASTLGDGFTKFSFFPATGMFTDNGSSELEGAQYTNTDIDNPYYGYVYYPTIIGITARRSASLDKAVLGYLAGPDNNGYMGGHGIPLIVYDSYFRNKNIPWNWQIVDIVTAN